MSATIVDGKSIAEGVLDEVARRTEALSHSYVEPVLAFVLIGESRPARIYASRLERLAGRVGARLVRRDLTADVSPQELEHEVATLNADAEVDGILVQLPLPAHLQSADLSALIDSRKDVDGITVQNAGRLYMGLPAQAPSTALAMVQILDAMGVEPRGKNAVVIGRSKIVGLPVAQLLLRRNSTVTVTHRSTTDLAAHTRQADILMAAAGMPHLVTGEMIKPGAVIVDAGINVLDGKVVGDVDFESCLPIAGVITPVPGGVGPVTNAVIMRSLIISAEKRNG